MCFAQQHVPRQTKMGVRFHSAHMYLCMLIQLWQSIDVIQFAKKGTKVVDCVTSFILLNPPAPETQPCYTHYYHSNDDEGCSSISATQTTYTCAHNLLVVSLARVNGQG